MMEMIDGEARHWACPDTFLLPDAAEIDRLRVGDFVKLGFEGEECGERLWFQVTALGPNWQGRLGQESVSFERRHILNVLFSPSAIRRLLADWKVTA